METKSEKELTPMKRLTTLFLIAALLMTAAAALAADLSPEAAARSVVPADAELLRTRTDDGLLECHFAAADGTLYEVDIDPASASVVHVDIDAPDQRGSASAVLTAEQAEAALLALWPEANIFLVQQDRDDGRWQYELHFSTAAFLGRADLNAETGALLDAELDYTAAARVQAQGPLSADEAKALALSLVPGGRMVEFETDREDGRTVYEGEIRSDSGFGEFVIDAQTGRFLEWETEGR